jgi:GH18 family chitinase
MKIKHDSNYSTRRKAEYPTLEDLADALYWESRGDASKMEAYYAKIDAIKAKYKKPTPPVNS